METTETKVIRNGIGRYAVVSLAEPTVWYLFTNKIAAKKFARELGGATVSLWMGDELHDFIATYGA